MAEVCCADEAFAECGMRNVDWRVLAPRGTSRYSAIRNPQSAIRCRMKFPSRLPIPPEVLKIAQQLEKAGYETWCVGGAVRDNLLGLDNHDFDLNTAAPPAEIQPEFKRTVPVGIQHGTVAVP